MPIEKEGSIGSKTMGFQRCLAAIVEAAEAKAERMERVNDLVNKGHRGPLPEAEQEELDNRAIDNALDEAILEVVCDRRESTDNAHS